MTPDAIQSGNHHGTVVAISRGGGWIGVLLLGPTGSGKSDIALRLIDRGGCLVADDRVILDHEDGKAVASPPPALSGKLAISGLGIVDVAHLPHVSLGLVVQIERDPPAYPMENRLRTICDVPLPTLRLDAFWPSAPILIERALDVAPGTTA